MKIRSIILYNFLFVYFTSTFSKYVFIISFYLS